jgi:hypothetical protein
MRSAPLEIIADDPDVPPAVRDLFSKHPSCQDCTAHELAYGLLDLRYIGYRRAEVAVEAALVALLVEGEVLA